MRRVDPWWVSKSPNAKMAIGVAISLAIPAAVLLLVAIVSNIQGLLTSDEVMGPEDEHSMEVQLGQCKAHKAMCEDELEHVKWELDAEIAEVSLCYLHMEVLEWSEEQCYEQCGEYDE